ncbi:MAG: hypothetical protein ACQET7_08930 [Thermodesulfobacteriota bacterium]
MAAGASIPFDSFRRIRDRALLLSIGKAYLCESPFLSRYGTELEQALGVLGRDIQELRKRFPGRFTREIDTDGILEGMRELALQLKEPDRSLQEKCTVGELGKDLEERLRALSEAVGEVRLQIEGGSGEYSGKEALSGAFCRAGDAVRSGFGILGKSVGVAVVVMAVVFGYLFITMEREVKFEDVIARNQEQVRVLEEDLLLLDKEMTPLEQRIEELESRGDTRRDKVRSMELSVELDELEQRAMVLRGKLAQHQRRINDAEASLEKLRRKGFLDRLLRK